MIIIIITLCNRKGGCGKSSLCAITLAGLGNNNLALDLDSQANLSTIMGGQTETDKNIYSVLTGKCHIREAIQHLQYTDLITSSVELANLNQIPSNALRDILTPLERTYKHIILDTPVALDAITFSALAAANLLIIPVASDRLTFVGVQQLYEFILRVQEKANPKLKIAGLVMMRYDGRSNLSQKMLEKTKAYAEEMGTHFFPVIRESVAIKESQFAETSIFDYAPQAKVTADCRAYIVELEEIINGYEKSN